MKRLLISSFSLLLFLGTGLSAGAQEAFKERTLHWSAGWLRSAERDLAYSPLSYFGAVPNLQLGYSSEGGKKSESLWLYGAAGELSNRFGGRENMTVVGLMNYTFFHRRQPAAAGLHFGWSNHNAWSRRDFEAAGNFSPRFDYHTSFGPAVRWRRSLARTLAIEVAGHFQVIGFVLQSAHVSEAPGGFEGDGRSGLGALWDSAALFYLGRAWDWGIWTSLRYSLPSGNSLSLAYRYDRTSLEVSHRSVRSRGYYLLTVSTRL